MFQMASSGPASNLAEYEHLTRQHTCKHGILE